MSYLSLEEKEQLDAFNRRHKDLLRKCEIGIRSMAQRERTNKDQLSLSPATLPKITHENWTNADKELFLEFATCAKEELPFELARDHVEMVRQAIGLRRNSN